MGSSGVAWAYILVDAKDSHLSVQEMLDTEIWKEVVQGGTWVFCQVVDRLCLLYHHKKALEDARASSTNL